MSSEIFKRNLEQARKINQFGNQSKIKEKINEFNEIVKRSEENIDKSLNNIKQYDAKKRECIYNLRKIMEDSRNHEDGKIYNKLKDGKERDYLIEIRNLKNLINQNPCNHERNLIRKEKTFMKTAKKNIEETNKIEENLEDEAIELGRKEILGLCIDFLKENQMNREGIEHLEKLRNDINNQ